MEWDHFSNLEQTPSGLNENSRISLPCEQGMRRSPEGSFRGRDSHRVNAQGFWVDGREAGVCWKPAALHHGYPKGKQEAGVGGPKDKM